MASPPPPGVPEALWARLESGVTRLSEANRIRVLCHYDADGATSAAILARTLLRWGKSFHISLTTVLDEATISSVRSEQALPLLVADMGSSQLDGIEDLDRPAVVLDHHKPPRDSGRVVHANPHLAGIDGAHGACGATLSWAFALAADPKNWDLAGIAMAGAIADRQHIPAYDGMNGPLFEEAVRRGILRRERGPAIPDRPLGEALSASYLPFFAGLASRPDEAAKALRRISIDPEATWRDLAPAKRQALASYLATHLMKQGAIPEAVENLIEDRYWIESLKTYAGDLADAVNACCRTGAEGLAVALALGDPAAVEPAEVHRQTYGQRILAHLTRLEREGPFQGKHLVFFYCDDAALAGNVAGIAIQYLWNGARPVLALSVTDGVTRASARGTKALVVRGLDLAAALREAATAVGGTGGGHDVASGATIPKGKEDKFVGLVDELVGLQLAPKAVAAE
ncbi:MAG TPA: DHHA1 domain-containing protein [Thermoplasmata archaeon]|nr:DHHA1 domain-containing protein [Thermoplasmata archaeon]